MSFIGQLHLSLQFAPNLPASQAERKYYFRSNDYLINAVLVINIFFSVVFYDNFY